MCVVVLVTAVNNYQKERQFRALQAVTDDAQVGCHPACCCWVDGVAVCGSAWLLFLPFPTCKRLLLFRSLLSCYRPPEVNLQRPPAHLPACLPACLQVRAIRHGREQALPVREVSVGDLLLVETGDILCTDGLLVAGSDVK